jgi:hypothetical protein
MLITGLTPRQLGALRPEHVNWSAQSLLAPKRLKGRRSRRQRARHAQKTRQLMPDALPVLKRFFAMHANRPFSSIVAAAVREPREGSRRTASARSGLPPIPAASRRTN